MIKKGIFALMGVMMLALGIATAAKPTLPVEGKLEILNTDSGEIIDTTLGNDTWREGARDAISPQDPAYKIDNLIDSDTKIDSQAEAQVRLVRLIQRMVNFALSFISFIAFVILLVAGWQMVTAGADDKAAGAGKAALLKVAKAIGGIAVSWLLVSMLFWLVEQLVK